MEHVNELSLLKSRVAELEAAEAKLRDRIEQLRQFYLNASFAYHSMDEAGRIAEVNQTWLDHLGYERDEVLGQAFVTFLHPDQVVRFMTLFAQLKGQGETGDSEFELVCKNGSSCWGSFSGWLDRAAKGSVHKTNWVFVDVTRQKRNEERREAERELLHICQVATGIKDLMQQLVAFFQRLTKCEAVGVRLHQEEDFPYYETVGFPGFFIRAENSLCAYDAQGGLIRDSSGNPVLECMCGNVLCGRFDPALPFFTAHGSFWTNSTSELLANTSDQERQGRTRNRCHGEGYESVALLPLRHRDRTFGLFQFNDRRPGCFSFERIEQLEQLVDYVALALAKHLVDGKLRYSEEKYRLVVEHAQEAIIVIQAQHIVMANPATLRLSGYPLEHLVNHPFIAFVHPEDRQMVLSHHADGLQGAAPPHYALRLMCQSGEVKWLDAHSSFIEWDGRPASLHFLNDITARLQSENALRESEVNLSAILNASTETIQLLDAEGRTIVANEATARRLHASLDQLIGRPVFDFFPPALAAQRKQYCQQVVNSGIPLTFQDEREGTAFETRLFPVTDGEGVVRRIAVFAVDITERKSVEQQLMASHALLTNLASQVPGVIYQYRLYPDGRSCFPYASPGMWDIYEVTPAEVQKDATPVFCRLHPDDHDRVAEDIFNSARTLKTFYSEFRVILPRQGLRWRWSQAQPQQLEDGSILWHGIISDITERKQAEEALQAREQYLHTILQTSAEGFWVLDPKGQVLEVNDAYLAMSGYDRQELLKLSIGDLDALELPEQTAARIKRIFTKGSERFETQHRRKDGSIFPVEVSSTWLDEEDGRMVCFCRDLSERKQAETALHHSHQLMQYIIEHTDSGVAVHDRDLRYIYVSQRYLEMYRLEEQDVIGRHHYEVFPDLPQKWRKVHQQALQGVVIHSERDSYLRANGTCEWTRWECRPWYEANGAIGGLVVYTEVITERVLAEEALRKNEEFQRAIIAASPLAIISLDPEGHVLGWNLAAEHIFGWSEGETIGRFPPFVSEEKTDKFSELRSKIMTGEVLSRVELVCCRKDGSPIMVSLSTAPIHNADGKLVAIMSVLEDISALKKAENEKKMLAFQLQQAQKMEAIGTLAGGIAHDFNNILGVILGYGEITKDMLPADAPTVKGLEKILEAGERAAELVKQILAFSRRSNVDKVPLEPVYQVKEALKLLRATLPSTITINQRLPTKTDAIFADPTQIHQIIMNLCTNAFHAMEQTGGVLEVMLKECDITQEDLLSQPSVQPGKFIVLTVADNGPGIASEIISKIFEPYFTTKGVGKGTGLGLAIVHGIVTDTGGFITCESELGQGTVFEVFLPTHEVEVSAQDMTIDGNPSGNERILFVDDESLLAEMGKTMLERLGYMVVSKTNSLEALATFQHRPFDFDAVITDQTMPNLTGMELSQRILQIRPEIPIILCTGFSNLTNEQQAKACGIKGFLMKPLSRKGLADLLRAVLDENAH